jgi:hypothetical protein
MTASSPDSNPALIAPIMLTGEGLAHMTPDRFDTLGRMVHGLGLVASRGTEVVAGTAESQDPHLIASELTQARLAERTLMHLIYDGTRNSTSDEAQALDRLVKFAIYDRIERNTQADPVLMGEVARCLIADDSEEARLLGMDAAASVFRTYLERDALEAALSVSDMLVTLGQNDSNEAVRAATQDCLGGIVLDLDTRISSGRSELQPLLNRLWQAEGYIVSVENAPSRRTEA